MQKKKEERCGFKLFVAIVFREINEPNKYEPLSPRNILAFGKLNKRNVINTIIWAVMKKDSSWWLLLRFINNKTELIIIKLIVNKPLKPSIKLAPFTINRKQRSVNNDENIKLFIQEFKKVRSIFSILIGKNTINKSKKNIIKKSLDEGLIFNFKSSK